MKKMIGMIILCGLISQASFAENEERDYTIKLFSFVPNLRLNIKNPKEPEGSYPLQYKGNVNINQGIGFDYKGFGVSVSKKAAEVKDPKIYGKTDYTDLQFYFFGFQQWGFDLYYQNYKGFYLQDQQNNLLGIRPDLKIINTGMNFYYTLDEKYSIRGAFTQSEKSKESSGGLLMMISLGYSKIKADSSIIPADQEIYYGKYAGLKSMADSQASIAPGYGYKYVFWDNFYASIQIFLGFGFMVSKMTTAVEEFNSFSISFKGNAKIGFGYDIESFFVGLSAYGDTVTPLYRQKKDDQSNIRIRPAVVYGEVFFGFRF